MGTHTGADRDGRHGRNGTGNGKRGRPVRVGQAVDYRDEKVSIGRGCVGVTELLPGGGFQLG